MKTSSLPLVVIAGRPNVGKSTLFNRLLGQRRSITDPTPGVTRDAVVQKVYIDDVPLRLADTGGVKSDGDGHFDDIVTTKSLSLLDEADLILFLTEAGEPAGEDMDLIERLRPFGEKVLLVVNKADDFTKEQAAWEWAQYGFKEIMAISALHNRNVGELEEALLGRIPHVEADEDEFEEEKTLSLAVLGKPNCGKSTLVNTLIGNEISLVSPIAGTTRDVIDGEFYYKKTHFTLYDTAGIRRKRSVRENVEYYSVNRAFKAIENTDVILLMVDALEGLSDQDKKISVQAVKLGKPIILVLSKWDQMEGKSTEEKAIDRVRFQFPHISYAPIICLSSLKNKGIGTILNKALALKTQVNSRVETNRLNEALKEWVDYTPIKSSLRFNYKIRYITQVQSAPIRFVLFVNKRDGFPQAYVKHVSNMIRKEFRISEVPIFVEVKESRKTDYSSKGRSQVKPSYRSRKKR